MRQDQTDSDPQITLNTLRFKKLSRILVLWVCVGLWLIIVGVLSVPSACQAIAFTIV